MTTSVPAAARTAAMRFIDERWFIRLLEIVPGAVTWLTLLLPIILSLLEPVWVAYFIIGFDLYWMVKSFRLTSSGATGHCMTRKESTGVGAWSG
jgi:hypothetical protein